MDDVVVIGELGEAGKLGDSDGAVTIEESSEDPLPKHAVRNDDGTVSLKLHVPVTLKWKKPGAPTPTEDVFADFTMHRLTGKDMMAIGEAGRGEIGMLSIALSAKISRHTFRHVYERMDASDIQAASAVIAHFLGNGPTTGR